MLPGVTVGLWGMATPSSDVRLTIRNVQTGAWMRADGALSDREEWLDAEIVDPQGTWRRMLAPTAPGSYELTVRADGSDAVSRSGFTVSGAVAPVPPDAPPEEPGAGQGFPLQIINRTAGRFADEDVYVTIIGQQSPGRWASVRADGTVRPLDSAQQRAPDALLKNGRSYAPLSFRLSATGSIRMPSHLEGGRVYLSLGSPLYLRIAEDGSGIALPDAANPADPNAETYWDFYEFTFRDGRVAFGGNTTQVDQFSFPISATVEQASTGFRQSTGWTASRAELFRAVAAAGDGYEQLVGEYRILSPRTSPAFRTSSTASASLDEEVRRAWSRWASVPLRLTADARPVSAQVHADGMLHLTVDGVDVGAVARPTAEDVWQCAGALSTGSVIELAVEAQLCAAFQRGVAPDEADWSAPERFYPSGSGNRYAAVLHAAAERSAAYAFPYDDVADQSSVIILPDSRPPSLVTLTIGW
jgi:hypothetical protein